MNHFKNKIMEITDRLRNTPTGLIVLVGDMKIVVEKYRPYYTLRGVWNSRPF